LGTDDTLDALLNNAIWDNSNANQDGHFEAEFKLDLNEIPLTLTDAGVAQTISVYAANNEQFWDSDTTQMDQANAEAFLKQVITNVA